MDSESKQEDIGLAKDFLWQCEIDLTSDFEPDEE